MELLKSFQISSANEWEKGGAEKLTHSQVSRKTPFKMEDRHKMKMGELESDSENESNLNALV